MGVETPRVVGQEVVADHNLVADSAQRRRLAGRLQPGEVTVRCRRMKAEDGIVEVVDQGVTAAAQCNLQQGRADEAGGSVYEKESAGGQFTRLPGGFRKRGHGQVRLSRVSAWLPEQARELKIGERLDVHRDAGRGEKRSPLLD